MGELSAIEKTILVLACGGLPALLITVLNAKFEKDEGFRSCNRDSEGSWAIGIYKGPSPFELRPIERAEPRQDGVSAWPVANPVITCESVKPAFSNFVADPFLFVKGSKLYLFHETKDSRTLQGDIGVAESSDWGITWNYLGIALDEPWHLSYPFVFEHDEEVYMMPEGSKKGDLRLYKAVDFPLKWKLEKVIIQKPLVDASLLHYNGTFWIFASDHSRPLAHKNGELEIWYASSILGPWKEHIRNPLKNGDRSLGARNAGRPFLFQNQPYRLGQDCGRAYGVSLRAFRIKCLSADCFQEEEVEFHPELLENASSYAWNSKRQHHADVVRLPDGSWMAAMDGDRVISYSVIFQLLHLLRFSVGIGLCTFLLLLCSCLSWRSLRAFAYSLILPNRDSGSPNSKKCFRDFESCKMERKSIYSITMKSKLSFCFLLLLSFFMVLSLLLMHFADAGFSEDSDGNLPFIVNGEYSKFTLAVMTYEARLLNLKLYLNWYSKCSSIQEIVVIWNKGKPPVVGQDIFSTKPLRVRVENNNSLNNRFKPDPLIKTRALLEMDDDILIPCDNLERGFAMWRQAPHRLVGFYPRFLDNATLTYHRQWYAKLRGQYNAILTGAAFLDQDRLLQLYWSDDDAIKKARNYVDTQFNCEDILMNFLVARSANASDNVIEYVRPSYILGTSRISKEAISRKAAHDGKRDACLRHFSSLFHGDFPLQYVQFDSRSDSWDAWRR